MHIGRISTTTDTLLFNILKELKEINEKLNPAPAPAPEPTPVPVSAKTKPKRTKEVDVDAE